LFLDLDGRLMIQGVGWDGTKQAKNEMAEFLLADCVIQIVFFLFWSAIGL